MKPTHLIFYASLLFAASMAKADTFSTKGNLVVPIENGTDLNERRLELIRSAKKFIYLKTFIINRDPSERPVFEALCQRAREGLDVRILVDDLGRRQGGNPIKSKKGDFSISWFKKCGVRFERYAKPMWGPIDFILYSQHDKLMVNEKSGIMGGTNFSRDYSAHAQLSKQWYDFDVALEGPAVCGLQLIFNLSWWRALEQEMVGIKKLRRKKRSRRIVNRFSPHTLEEECSHTEVANGQPVTIIFNDPKFSKERPFEDYIIDSLAQARELGTGQVVSLYAPYFIPNKRVMAKIIETARAGIKIRIITNSESSIDPEAFPAYAAMLMRVRPLLESGVEIHLWAPAHHGALKKDNVFHKKGGCFGTLNCFVGSHNLDVRGDKYSSEIIAVLSDETTVRERNESFESDLRYTIPMTLESRRKLLKNSKITSKIAAMIAGWAM